MTDLTIKVYAYGHETIELPHDTEAYTSAVAFFDNLPEAFVPICGSEYVLTEAVMLGVGLGYGDKDLSATCTLYGGFNADTNKWEHFRPNFQLLYYVDKMIRQITEVYGKRPEQILMIPEPLF